MSEPASDVVGVLVAGKYRIKRRIGAGGMGAVYEGEHIEIGKRVAVKIIEHEHAKSDELAKRFRREARAASAVESEHIVQVFDVGTDERVGLYMVMEILSGEDLSSRLEKNGGRIPVEEAIAIGMQTARGLAKAHAAGVVHRDLKPANLFLTQREDGSTCVKILDFGISKLARKDEEDAKGHTLTRAGAVMGTPMYMSPEQAQGLPVDARADLWSLAVALYEALAGQPPYDARDTYEQMIVQIVTQRPKALADIAPWVPQAIARVLEHALAHDLNERTPDAATFARELADAARLPDAAASSRTGRAAGADSAAALAATVSAGSSVASVPSDVASAASTGGSPPTNIGVVVPQSVTGSKRSTAGVLVAALAAVAVVGIVVAFAVRGKEQTAGAGLIADRSPDPVASAMSSAAPVPGAPGASTTLTALAPASALAPSPSASVVALAPSASASAAPPRPGPRPAAGAKPTGGAPAAAAATPAQATPTAKPQYGGAGVSTTY